MQVWNDCEIRNCFGDDLGPGLRRIFMDNSFNVASNNEFYINYNGNEPAKINQWLCTLENKEALFSCFPVLCEKEGLIFPTDAKLTAEAENRWCFIDNPGSGKRSKNRLERLCSYHKPQLLYAAAQIFSKDDSEKIYFVNNGHNPIPMKIWVNGRLIFSCYKENLIRRSEGIVRLKKGTNLILVEREIIPQHKIKDMFMDTNFTFTLYPVSYLLGAEMGRSFLKKEMFDDIGNMVDIITQKKIFEPGEVIPYYITQHNNDPVQEYEVQVLDANGIEVYYGHSETALQAELVLKTDLCGVFRINIKKEGRVSAVEYIFIGDINDIGFTKADYERARDLLHIFDFSKNVVRNSIYPIDKNVYHHIFENLYFLSALNDDRRGYFFLDFIETRDQGRKRSFGVLLPKGYNKEKKYPLIVEYTAGYGDYAIPGLNGGYPEYCLRNNRYEKAVVAFIACDYEYINIYELMAMGDICNYLTETYAIDRQRISIMGFCGSTNSCMRLLLTYRGIFSSALFLSPYIDEETLKEMEKPESEAMCPYLVLNPSTGLFLPGTAYADYYQSEVTVAPGLEHEELFSLYNNEYLLSFLTERMKMKRNLQISLSEQIKPMGIAGMYTGKCAVLCDTTDENEKKMLRELLIFMQLTKYRNLEIHTEENFKVPEKKNIFCIFRLDSITKETAQEIWEDVGVRYTDGGIFWNGLRYEGPFFAVILSKNRKMCYVFYDSSEALSKLKDLWGEFGSSALFYRDTILWNKEEGFIEQVDKI